MNMRKQKMILLECVLVMVFIIPCQGQLIQPEDLEYVGAFRLPDELEEIGWAWSGAAMAYYPGGDPEGPDDGYPGSIFGTGHNWYQYVSEITIPVPVHSPAKNLSELNTAVTLQPFQDIKGGLFPEFEIPRAGLEYLPAQGEQIKGKLYFCWAQHMGQGDTNPSHGWCELDLSNPQTAGAWRIGNYWNYVTTDYIFEIPQVWADAHTPGMYLVTGRFRDGGQGARGPSLLAYGPWNEGNPPAPGSQLQTAPLLLYTDVTSPDEYTLNGYHHSDEWSGGAWITTGDRSAVIFVGTKGTGECWYGFADGTVWPDEPPYPPVPDPPHDERGWWSTGFEGQILFYDPADLAAVARGEMEPYEPQPYAALNIDEYLYHIESSQQWYHVGAAGFDRDRGLLYVFEPLVDNDKSIVHTWRVKPGSTQGSPRIRLNVDVLQWDFAWVDRPSPRTLTISNDGDGVLEVTHITTDDSHFVSSLNEMNIGALESQDVIITFTPSGENTFEATLIIQCNDAEHPEVHVSLYGAGIVGCQGGEMGDVNGDRYIDIIDVLKVINHMLGIHVLFLDEACRADCTTDGAVDVVDALGLVNHILDLDICGP
ncbi:MAG: hypothetical protein JSV84_08165 [Gemmatimonadota bacterium]|nr:MAG: hypothetical protein JSV84_08165 [Gemmatimonadota bacterium]